MDLRSKTGIMLNRRVIDPYILGNRLFFRFYNHQAVYTPGISNRTKDYSNSFVNQCFPIINVFCISSPSSSVMSWGNVGRREEVYKESTSCILLYILTWSYPFLIVSSKFFYILLRPLQNIMTVEENLHLMKTLDDAWNSSFSWIRGRWYYFKSQI